MKTYKTLVTYDTQNGKTKTFIEGEYRTKSEFIKDLRANGYHVDNRRVKTKEVYDYYIENGNIETIEDFGHINEMPKAGETADMAIDRQLAEWLVRNLKKNGLDADFWEDKIRELEEERLKNLK